MGLMTDITFLFHVCIALRNALKRLGFEDTYHMTSTLHENRRDSELWLDALQEKADGVGTFEKANWDQLLGHCQVSLRKKSGDKRLFYTRGKLLIWTLISLLGRN